MAKELKIVESSVDFEALTNRMIGILCSGFLLLTFLLLSSCKTALNANKTFAELKNNQTEKFNQLFENPDFKSCEISKKIKLGNIKMINNQWGISSLPKNSLNLCIFHKNIENNDVFGWKWETKTNRNGVFAYPSLVIGNEWGASNHSNFPVRITEIDELKVKYSSQNIIKGLKFNLSFDIWLVNKVGGNPKNLTHEIMFWEDYNDFRPDGKFREIIDTPYGKYKVYVGIMDKSKSIGLKWKYVAFVRIEKRNSGDLDLLYFFEYLKRIYFLNDKYMLNSIELGNEVGRSSGYTMIDEFSVEFRKKP